MFNNDLINLYFNKLYIMYGDYQFFHKSML